MIKKWCNFLIDSWWVLSFILLCLIVYERAIQKKNSQFVQLQNQLMALNEEKNLVLKKQQDLEMQINSQSDVAWLELTLMKDLGLVSEDQQKIFFYTTPPNSP